MSRQTFAEELKRLLPSESDKRIRQAIMLAYGNSVTVARGVRNQLDIENRIKDGILVEGDLEITSTTSATLSGWAWVVDFAVQDGGVQTIPISAPHATFPRIDYFHGDGFGVIHYTAGLLDGLGNSIFPSIPAGHVILKKVLRNTNGTNQDVPIEDQLRDPALPFVSYEQLQGRSAAQKAKARTNIGSTASIPQPVASAATLHNLARPSNLIIITGSTAATISGLVAGEDGEEVCIFNSSSQNVTIPANDTGSDVVNRFQHAITIPPNCPCFFKYRADLNRWTTYSALLDSRYMRKDVADTRTGTMTHNGQVIINSANALVINTQEDGSASSNVVSISNTNGGGFFLQRRGSLTVRARGDSVTNYFILRLQNSSATPTTVFEVAATGSPKVSGRSEGFDFLTRRDELGINYPQTVPTAGTIHDLAINADTKLLILTAATDLTGIIAEEGRKIVIYADGGDRIIRHENAGSGTINRFSIGTDITIPNGTWREFIKISNRWRRSI